MKAKEKVADFFKTRKNKLTYYALLAVVILVALCVLFLSVYNSTPEVDTTALNKLLVEASDLTTAKLHVTNVSEFKDSGIKLLNRSDFIMVYDATIWAGIKMDEVKLTKNEQTKTIHVLIPRATIQNAKVDPTSIKYFDEKFALFNVNSKEDANKASALAEDSLIEEAAKYGILELADKQSATLIEGLLLKAIPKEYTLSTTLAD